MDNIKCLKCEKEFEPKRETAKFCSDSCRVMWHRKNGKNRPVTKTQVQVLYSMALSALTELKNHKPAELPADYLNVTKIGVLGQDGTVKPLSFSAPQTALKSFEQWQRAKVECENEDDWEKIKAGIEAATNLTQKQKNLLIKYS